MPLACLKRGREILDLVLALVEALVRFGASKVERGHSGLRRGLGQ
jgi:hypothetical protein